ncbi:solute carrier family 22 member 1-like [Bombyx mandarina]|uniref:Major facilitator superfamily (MFS) profile domain-containing protein n=2 Tax=Bombyx TaxID=7090 RepID=A0A8R2AM26_BOMMO|nr:solute carrier family 22 member 1 [Bombyx mori]XP_028031450.1 solute carrier family 22 member 1-like [Bombyx mandarina]
MLHIKNPVEKHFEKITRYHLYFYSLVFISQLPNCWHLLSIIFLSPTVDFYCNSTDGSSILKNKCPCNDPQWDKRVFTKTVQTKFGIYCDKKWLISFSESMTNVGTLLGASLFGMLSDKHGRLSMLSLSCFIVATSGCVVSIMPNIGSFIFMRCIEGLGAGGAMVTAYVLCIEYSGVNDRETVSALFHIPVTFSHITLPAVSYFLRDCNQFQLAISIPLYAFVTLTWLLLESPKWLMDNGRIDDAAMVMNKIAKFNKQPQSNIKAEIIEYNRTQNPASITKLNFFYIFKDKNLTTNFACMSWIYFVCGLGYYGVSEYISGMSKDIHRNVAISGMLILPGTLAAVILLKRLYRRTFLMSTCFLSGIFMIVVISTDASSTWMRLIMACICNCFFFLSFIIVFLYGVELFPTSIRNSVLGILSLMSRLGQIAAPPVVKSLSEITSGSVFGVTAILGAVTCFPLPETKGMELPSSLQHSKTLPRRKSMLEQSIMSAIGSKSS